MGNPLWHTCRIENLICYCSTCKCGFEVLRYLQKHRRGLPVVLLSGMPVDEIQYNMHGLPTHELPTLFLKPIDLDQLVQVIQLQVSGEFPDVHSSGSESVGSS